MPDQILIDQCAPTLAGLKTGNMFPVSIEPGQDICAELRSLNRLLREKGIAVAAKREARTAAISSTAVTIYADISAGLTVLVKNAIRFS